MIKVTIDSLNIGAVDIHMNDPRCKIMGRVTSNSQGYVEGIDGEAGNVEVTSGRYSCWAGIISIDAILTIH